MSGGLNTYVLHGVLLWSGPYIKGPFTPERALEVADDLRQELHITKVRIVSALEMLACQAD